MKTLVSFFPKEFNNYHEPFVGAGSVFMELVNRGVLTNKQINISDAMMSLINLYVVTKFNAEELIEELRKKEYANTSEIYYRHRCLFNTLKQELEIIEIGNVELAALFIYLNRTGFNGMYRENAKGQFNVPYGKMKYENVLFNKLDAKMKKLQEFLNMTNVTIRCIDYQKTSENIYSGDFVYMDPPYYGTFTGYNKDIFGEKQQKELHDFILRLTQRGVKVALSNSNCKFIRELYNDIPNVKMIELSVRRNITSKKEDRANISSELLILNY